MQAIHRISRDNAWPPMQRDDSSAAGFTLGIPWLKFNPNYKEINVVNDLKDPDSIFYYYQKLICLRKENLAIVYSDYQTILEDDEKIYAYLCTLNKEHLLIILNFSAEGDVFNLLTGVNYKDKELLINNYRVDQGKGIKKIALRPYEARVYRLS